MRGPPSLDGLTMCEREMLELLARGWAHPAIGRHLGIADKTVRNFVSNVLVKLQAATRAEAIVRAREAGLGTGRIVPGRTGTSASRHQAITKIRLGDVHILLVDPHELFWHALADLLADLCRSEACEVDVTQTADPETAASLATQEPFALALVDLTIGLTRGAHGRPPLFTRLATLRPVTWIV
jgi:DNA-binding NarL/FixJ family response regulator